MKTALFAFVVSAASLFAQDMIYPDGSWHADGWPAQVDGVILDIPALVARGYRLPTAADYAARYAAQQQTVQADYYAKVSAVAGRAMLFREALEKHFGAGACTNTAVTFAAVEQYFAQRYLAGTADPLDSLDLSILQDTFPMITDITGDGTIWTFPWNLIPEPGLP